MSLDIYLEYRTRVFDYNITHNLAKMARAAGLYEAMWRPDEMPEWIDRAAQLIPYLEAGIAKLKAERESMLPLNPENGWGDYDGLLKCAEAYLEACKANPGALPVVSR